MAVNCKGFDLARNDVAGWIASLCRDPEILEGLGDRRGEVGGQRLGAIAQSARHCPTLST